MVSTTGMNTGGGGSSPSPTTTVSAPKAIDKKKRAWEQMDLRKNNVGFVKYENGVYTLNNGVKYGGTTDIKESLPNLFYPGPVTEEELLRKEQFRHDLLNAMVDIVPLALTIASAGGIISQKPYGKISRNIIGIGRKYYGRTVKRY